MQGHMENKASLREGACIIYTEKEDDEETNSRKCSNKAYVGKLT
jgi:hypothetical protein